MDGQVIAVETKSVGYYDLKDQRELSPFQIERAKLILPRALAEESSTNGG